GGSPTPSRRCTPGAPGSVSGDVAGGGPVSPGNASGDGPVGSVQVSLGLAPGITSGGGGGVPAGEVDGNAGAAPSPTSGSPIGRGNSGGGTPAGRSIASSCPLVSLMR